MRGVITFTIDPIEAKDFDDALSFLHEDDDTWQVGVHIADVTHYVEPGSDLDKRAYDLGTSTYLVDRVLPMLPEELSNDLCSLNPHEDKLCMSVIFTLSRDAQVLKYKVCRTVINSDYRFHYGEVQSILDGQSSSGSPELDTALVTLNGFARTLRQQRMTAGALDLEQDELCFQLDEEGNPVDIWFHKATEANHLIEEFMLLANRTIATHIGKTNKPMVYRVHDKPDTEKLENLERFRRQMGDNVPAQTLDMLLVRAMAKAVYSTHNIGHYGLAFPYYTHFTSPIRRYPDMMVHRLVAQYILGERVRTKGLPPDLEEACRHCSDAEQAAAMAERDSQKEMLCRYMSSHIGEEHEGTIVNVTDFGLFVQLNDSHAEGLVHIRTICPDHYLTFDEKNFCLRTTPAPEHTRRRRGRAGRKKINAEEGLEEGHVFTLGDQVRVRIMRADAEKRQIDFELIDT